MDQDTDLEIVLEEVSDGPCNGGKWATADVTKKGPFEIVSENVDKAFLVRPKEMLMAMTALFRHHLMGDEEYKSWFYREG